MKKSHYFKLVFSLLSIVFAFALPAKEGMWIPSRIQQLVGDDMAAMGMKISVEELYSINKSSIKDAVVHFGGGCTSVLVSGEGLLLTNHHCGYSRIQSHSTLENDYLEDGFWAMNKSEELPNEGLTAAIIKEIRDVTDLVMADMDELVSEEDRAKHISAKIEEIVAEATKDSHYEAYIKPFYFGNQYLLFITEVFNDVRLVGAPPSSIGKFGFDTDNWVWPRHTGDFSVFRVYANAENKPAEYSEDNKPYQPLKYLPVNLNGADKGDFTLVYGFPGRTDNYITSAEVTKSLEVINPQRIEMRRASLAVIDQAMRSDKLLKIQYAAKQSRISNAYKKWIGQNKGLIRHKAVAKRDSIERVFTERVKANADFKSTYGNTLAALNKQSEEMLPLDVGRNYFIEFYYMGPEILRFAESFATLVAASKSDTTTDEQIEALVKEQFESMGFFKNYSAAVDEKIMKAQLPITEAALKKYLSFNLIPDMGKASNLNEYTEMLYANSIFSSSERTREFLVKYKRSAYKKIEKDPAFQMAMRMIEMYYVAVRPKLIIYNTAKEQLMRDWMKGMMTVIPERTYYADANSTLRITYGKVEGYEPFDGANYMHYTTLEGVMEKEDATNPEFVVPAKLKKLYETKNYGRYADQNGQIRVAFTASNHTSGGNSGSPVIDANGNLIGLNFDRTWESTMSDIMFNAEICRNITVDIRYVLFIMDKYADAGHLVDEMTLVE